MWSDLWEVGAVHRFGKRGAPAPRSSPGSSCTPRPAVIGTSRPTNSAFRRMLLAICILFQLQERESLFIMFIVIVQLPSTNSAFRRDEVIGITGMR